MRELQAASGSSRSAASADAARTALLLTEGRDRDNLQPSAAVRTAMGIKGIDHWVIVAGDLERTLDFYRRLGFTIAWENRPGRPDMATIRINDAQKINVHGPDAPACPAYLGARRPTIGGADFCLEWEGDRKSTRLNSSHLGISY